MSILFTCAMCILACLPGAAYILRVLLFDAAAPGPFEAKQTFVKVDDLITRPVNAFDWVRRFFGAYRIRLDRETGVSFWSVNPKRITLWQCPKCLSFWLSIPWTVGIGIYLLLSTGDLRNLFVLPLIQGWLVYVSQFLVFLQLKVEQDG